jgi:1-acyl-sn-glycerol-3-phosphate acyltransferase
VSGLATAALRRQVWRAALTLTGGLRVDGRLPRGGCIVVANHASHADTAALLAALPARSRPLVICAADYWRGSGRLRRLVSRTLVETLAVRRGGGGSADLETAIAALRDGRAVVVFPEGRRSRDGELGAFHSGAFRLAARASVPVVPVGLDGTRDLLPAHGELRRAPVAVRIGAPMPGAASPVEAAIAARSAVERLTRPRALRPDSLIRGRVARLAGSWWGVALVAGWAGAEAFSWPIVPEFVVGVLVLASPRHVLRLALTAITASTLGAMAALALAGAGAAFPEPLVTPAMRAAVVAEIRHDGAQAVVHQPLSGIPIKVYAAQEGRAHVSPLAFAWGCLRGRDVRILLISGALALIAAAGHRWRHYYPAVVTMAVGLFGVGLAAVVTGWS